MRLRWLESTHESLAVRISLSPLSVLSWVYGSAAAMHRFVYERRLLRRRQLASAVISVGNLTVGGSGKTPLAACISRARKSNRPPLRSTR